MRQPVVRSALLFGLIVAALRALQQGAGVLIALAATNSGPAPGVPNGQVFSLLALVSLGGFVLFFVNLGLYLLAGMFAARQTGSVGSGSVAGLLAGALAGLIGAAITIGVYAAGLTPLGPLSTSPTSTPDYQVFLIIVSVSAAIGVAFDIGYGAGLGALGGLIGRSSYEKTHPVAPPMPGMYAPPWAYAPGMYPGYPGAYPPPPGYAAGYGTGYGVPSPYMPYPPYPPYPAPASGQPPGEPWPAAYPPPPGYAPGYPPPPPLPTTPPGEVPKTDEAATGETGPAADS